MTQIAPNKRRVSLPRRLALTIEAAFSRLRTPRSDPPVIDAYLGYATPDALILRGRVLTALRRTRPQPEHGRWTNFRQMVSLFLTSEVAGVAVEGAGARTESDEEGYFTLIAPMTAGPPGWRDTPIRVAGRPETEVAARALVADPAAPCLVISDIDDTVLETGAYSLLRNLWTSLTGNAGTRRVHGDAAALLRGFRSAGAPIFYVSSGPWNLHHFLGRVFARNDVPEGPIFLRDFGLSAPAAQGGGHKGHKGAAIDAILSAHPALRTVLIGDTGQEDARIYADAAARWAGRVAAVMLREPTSRRSTATEHALAELEATGVDAHAGPTLPPADRALLRD